MIKSGASINITDCAGWTSLHIAAYRSKAEIVEYLLNVEADGTLVNNRGETPWDLVTEKETENVFLTY